MCSMDVLSLRGALDCKAGSGGARRLVFSVSSQRPCLVCCVSEMRVRALLWLALCAVTPVTSGAVHTRATSPRTHSGVRYM